VQKTVVGKKIVVVQDNPHRRKKVEEKQEHRHQPLPFVLNSLLDASNSPSTLQTAPTPYLRQPESTTENSLWIPRIPRLDPYYRFHHHLQVLYLSSDGSHYVAD
jgi:hypothetical protein